MSKILTRYLLKEMAIPFFLCLVVFSFVLLMDKIMRLTELVVNKGVTLGEVSQLFMFLLPSFLVYIVPVAVLISILLAFGRLSSDHEITAMKASGISIYQLLPAVLSFGIAAGIFTAIISLYLAPFSNFNFKNLLFQITRTKATVGIKERIFNQDFQGLTLYINKITFDGQVLKGVMVSDQRQGKETGIIVADQGSLVPDSRNLTLTLRLENGSVHLTSPDLQSYRKVDFSVYDLKLDLDRVLAATRNKGLGEMAFEELKNQIAKLQDLDSLTSLRKAQVEFNKKFAFPLASLVFALVAMPLGIQSRRAGRLSGFTLGLGVLFLSYLFLIGGEQLALREVLPAYLAMALGNLLYLGAGLYLLVTTAREKDLRFPAKVGQALETVFARLSNIRAKVSS